MSQPILILDVDGVIIEGFPRERWDHSLKADLGIDPLEMQQTFFANHWHDVLRGHKPIEPPLAEFLETQGGDVSVPALLDYWHGNDAKVNRSVLDAASKWKSRTGGTLAVATNQDLTRARYLRHSLGFDEIFDVIVVSCEIGVIKPEPGYFAAADVLLARREGQPVVFLDDMKDNVLAARSHGWDSFHVTPRIPATKIIETL